MKTKPNSPQIVPCPKWIQRDMLSSLKKTARSRISPDRAARAREILEHRCRKLKTDETSPACDAPKAKAGHTEVKAKLRTGKLRLNSGVSKLGNWFKKTAVNFYKRIRK